MTPSDRRSPRVTVIIATYNWSSVLAYAITSVLGQTMDDFELLVIGDGCTDDSAEVAARSADPRVRWINLPAHTGHQSEPNNRGLAEARGEFIAYLGHDDLWLPHHLECLVNAMDSTKADLAYSALAHILPDQRVGLPVVPFLRRNPRPSSTLHRRSVTDAIGGWRDYRILRTHPDGDFWRRAEAAGFAFSFVPRLTVLKFPASERRDVYRSKPSHEQAAWLQRIRSEPDLESIALVEMILAGAAIGAMPARALLPLLIRELRRRLSWRRVRAAVLFRIARGGGIDADRKYKGL
jgi:glycosyltransferase involved in cell wall biosynthesis